MQTYLDLVEEQYEGDREFDTHEIPWGLLNQD
jgi:hypothetical protein